MVSIGKSVSRVEVCTGKSLVVRESRAVLKGVKSGMDVHEKERCKLVPCRVEGSWMASRNYCFEELTMSLQVTLMK